MKTILITGGAGSLGLELTKKYLKDGYIVRVYSRDEYKHWKLKQELNKKQLANVRFLIGDIRDKDRLTRACEGVDILIHAAALKQIESGEYNPQEVVKTNVVGTSNVIDACLDNNIPRCAFISSDKASNPSNTYGASKYMGEKLWIDANNIKGNRDMTFFAFRFGNLRGSAGSVWELWKKQIAEGKEITVTDPNMTRFDYTLEQASGFIYENSEYELPCIYIPKMKWYYLKDLVKAFGVKSKKIGLRKGEKMYEETVLSSEIGVFFRDAYIILDDKDSIPMMSIRSGEAPKMRLSVKELKKSLYIS